MTSENKTNMTEMTKARAARTLAKYPQYRGHFDNYILVQINRQIKTKFGIAFEKGDYAIARPATSRPEFGSRMTWEFRTVWSDRNNIDTSVPEKYLTVVA